MQADHVQTKREIEAVLDRAGLRPRKRFGQHFLIDGNLMRRLAESAGLQPDDVVLEVGPGTGGLTDLLAARAREVIAVEVDRDLLTILTERFAGQEHVKLFFGDILDSKHRLRPEVRDALGDTESAKLVANLPYQVATPLVMNLLVDYPRVRRLCFTVQAEVGERLVASAGSKTYGPLSVVAQALSRIETVARIPPQAFWPQPAVDSVMLRMDVGASPFPDSDTARAFAALVRGAFEHRRKTLRSALGYVLEERERKVLCERWDGNRRPESFRVEEWLQMYLVLHPFPNKVREIP